MIFFYKIFYLGLLSGPHKCKIQNDNHNFSQKKTDFSRSSTLTTETIRVSVDLRSNTHIEDGWHGRGSSS